MHDDDKPTVLVLGAGFTKAFVPNAPLLEDKYSVEPLLDRYRNGGFRYARNWLLSELGLCDSNNRPQWTINIERLMTRLASGMPYDRSHDAELQREMVLRDIKDMFLKVLNGVEIDPGKVQLLDSVASKCLSDSIPIITFNYDTFLDEALAKEVTNEYGNRTILWHPNNGYGIVMQDMFSYVHKREMLLWPPETELLKLHGSTSWRLKKGAQRPFSIDAVLHLEPWCDWPDESGERRQLTQDQYDYLKVNAFLYLEQEPFIIPPVLNKSTFTDYPLLEGIWTRAYERLSKAERVIFVGYSLPVTDNLTSHLFMETLTWDSDTIRTRDFPPEIQVVNYVKLDDPDYEAKTKKVKEAYEAIFYYSSNIQFRFDGAEEWAKDFIQS
jgi:hypothetical protein